MSQDTIETIFYLADNEARALSHGFVGTIHVLLALLKSRVFSLEQMCKTYNFSVTSVKRVIGERLARDDTLIDPDGDSRGVVAKLRDEVARLARGSRFVTEIYLVLAVLKESSGVAVAILRELGVNVELEIMHLEWTIEDAR